jgi:hypothetical protein
MVVPPFRTNISAEQDRPSRELICTITSKFLLFSLSLRIHTFSLYEVRHITILSPEV